MNEPKNNFQKCYTELLNDTSSGAAELGLKSLLCVELAFVENIICSEEDFIKYSSKIIVTHPMASIETTLTQLYLNISSLIADKEPEEIINKIKTIREQLLLEKKKTIFSLKSVLIPFSTILVFSYSSTVIDSLKGLPPADRKKKKIYILESRPLNEGHIVAKRLAKFGYNVKLGIDMAISTFSNEANVAVIGCDSILSTGNIINKLGSTTVALWFKKKEKPVICATDSSKFSLRSFLLNKEIEIPFRPSEEIFQETKSDFQTLSVWNKYFEIVPINLINRFIVDNFNIDKPNKEKIWKIFSKYYHANQYEKIRRIIG